MGRNPKPTGKIKNVHIIDHYSGVVSFVVETPWDGDIDCDIQGKRGWSTKTQQPMDLVYDWDYGLCCSIDRGQPDEEEIAISAEGMEMVKKAAKKLAELSMKTNHLLQMKNYLQKHPMFLILK